MVKAEIQETLPMLWSVGQKLANYRAAHDVTIKEMALRTGLSTSLLSQLERGIGNPTISVLAALAEGMGISMADLVSLSDLTCGATAYALAQGAANESGAAVYWLRDCLENGLHPIISASGALTLPGDSVTPGIRPMMTLNLESFTFTNGSGTAEDPFRIQ